MLLSRETIALGKPLGSLGEPTIPEKQASQMKYVTWQVGAACLQHARDGVSTEFDCSCGVATYHSVRRQPPKCLPHPGAIPQTAPERQLGPADAWRPLNEVQDPIQDSKEQNDSNHRCRPGHLLVRELAVRCASHPSPAAYSGSGHADDYRDATRIR